MNRRTMWASGGIALLALTACGGGEDDNNAAATLVEQQATTEIAELTSTTEAAPTTSVSALAQNQYQVGDLVLTIHERIDDAPGGVFKPEPLTRWIAFDVEYLNPTPETVFVSTYGMMEMALSDNRRIDATLLGINDEAPVDGDIPPGASLRGWVTFEVPNDVEAATLFVRSDFAGETVSIEL